MIGRIVPYSEVFVSVTLSLDEASALSDMVSSLNHKDPSVAKIAAELGTVLEENLERAAAYKVRRGV